MKDQELYEKEKANSQKLNRYSAFASQVIS